MKQSLKHSVQQHLNKKSLSTKQLNELLVLQEIHHKQPKKTYFVWYKMATVASILMISVVLSLYFTNTTYFSTQTIEQRIAEEVAGNHLKLKPLEISANTMQGISGYFKQLNFLPVSPTLLTLSKQTLLGGRYCSIQGVTALQLRMMNNKTNKVQSLYETEYNKLVFKDFPKTGEGSPPLTVYVKGLKVDMWVEKDILFALIE
jgi:hypothetical protein